MKEKKLMHMKRAELVEIIYQLQQNEEELRAEVSELKAQIKDRRIRIEESGSVAEAALRLSGIFEAAQKAADIYLEELGLRKQEAAAEPEEAAEPEKGAGSSEEAAEAGEEIMEAAGELPDE